MRIKKIFSQSRCLKWHSYLGFHTSILLFIICLSGTLATISHEIDWLIYEDLRVDKPDNIDSPYFVHDKAMMHDWGASYENAKKAYPEVYLSFLTPSLNAYTAIHFVGFTKDKKRRRIYLDPYTNEVQGNHSWINIQRILRTFHMILYIPNGIGKIIVTFFGFILLILIITGLVVYRQFYKGFFKLRLHKGFRLAVKDIHKLIAVWSLWFLFVIALSAIWYFTENKVFMYKKWQNAQAVAQNKTIKLENPVKLYDFNGKDINHFVKIAQSQYDGLKVSTLVLPFRSKDKVKLYLSDRNPFLRNRANIVKIDPVSFKVLSVKRSEELNTYDFLTDLADPLHFGNFAGFYSKIVYFIFGLLLCVLILTGAMIYYQRLKKKYHNLKLLLKV